jgi:hypothetical protein
MRFPVAFVFVAAAAVTAHVWAADSLGNGARYFRGFVRLGGAAVMAFALTLRLEIRDIHRRYPWLVGLGLAALLYFVAPPFRSPQGVAFLSVDRSRGVGARVGPVLPPAGSAGVLAPPSDGR